MTRANGEGTVSKRSDGRWEARWFENDALGKRKRRSAYRASEAAAKKALRDALRRVDDGLPGVDSRSTLATYSEHWSKTTLAVDDVKDSTRRLYRDALRLWVLPHLGHRKLGEIRPGDVEALLVKLTDLGLSHASRQMAHKTLRRVLQTAVRDGLLARNPASAVTAPSGPRAAKVVPNRAQVAAMIEGSTGQMRALVGLLSYTGMRVGEALALRWSEVDLDKGTVLVSGTLQRDRDRRELVRTAPKTGRSHRLLPLPMPAVEILRSWRREQASERLAATWWGDGDWLLSTPIGTPLDASNVAKTFRPLAASAGCAGASFHSLRHAAATILLEEGVPMRVVSELLGHSTTRLTEDLYSHVTARLTETASAALTRALSS